MIFHNSRNIFLMIIRAINLPYLFLSLISHWFHLAKVSPPNRSIKLLDHVGWSTWNAWKYVSWANYILSASLPLFEKLHWLYHITLKLPSKTMYMCNSLYNVDLINIRTKSRPIVLMLFVIMALLITIRRTIDCYTKKRW